MNTHPDDVQSILRRIEALERQNRQLKQIAVGGLLLLLTAMLCGLSSGEQQKDAAPKGQAFFDEATKAAQVALGAKSQANPMAYQFGLSEAVRKCKDSSLPGIPYQSGCYVEVTGKISNLSGKADYLAAAADDLQGETSDIRGSIRRLSQIYDKNFDQVRVELNSLEGLAADNDSRIRAIQAKLVGIH